MKLQSITKLNGWQYESCKKAPIPADATITYYSDSSSDPEKTLAIDCVSDGVLRCAAFKEDESIFLKGSLIENYYKISNFLD